MADFTITTSPVNTNTWLSQNNLYVWGFTRIRVQCTPAQGSSFTSYDVTVGDKHYTGADVTTSVISSYGSNGVDGNAGVQVTANGPGGSVRKLQNVAFLGYLKPALTTLTAERGTYNNGTWTSDPEGAHIRVEAIATVSLSAQGNTGTITVQIGNTNPSATSGNYYYFTGTSATSSYTITGTVTDQLYQSTTRTTSVSSAEVPFNIDVDIPGAAFGKVTEKANAVDIAPGWSLNANGMHNTATVLPYSFRTTGGSSSAGWVRIATLDIQTPTVSGQTPKINFEVHSRLLGVGQLQVLLNGSTLGNCEVLPTPNSTLCNINGDTNTIPFVKTISSGVFDVYYPKANAGDEFTVYTKMNAELQDVVKITYADAIMTTFPTDASIREFVLVPYYNLSVRGSVGLGAPYAGRPYFGNANELNLSPDWSLVANGKNNQFAYMPYSFTTSGSGSGYARIATITQIGTYLSGPITFDVYRDYDYMPVRISVRYSAGDTYDSNLTSFYYDDVGGTYSQGFAAFIVKTATYNGSGTFSTWDIYVGKPSSGSAISVMTWENQHQMERCTITYVDDLKSSVIAGATMATLAPRRQIDFTAGHYMTAGDYAINLNNSDVIGANGIYWADASNAKDEALNFARSNGNWDSIYAYEGDPYFRPDHPTDTATTAVKILTQSNVRDYVNAMWDEGGWHCLSWYSGRKECYGTFTTTINAGNWNAWGSLYEGQPTSTLRPNYPGSFFTTAPTLNASVSGSSGACGYELYGDNSTTRTPQIIILRPNVLSSGNATFLVHLHAIGS